MPGLSVRGIDEEVYRRLKIRAAEYGISMEEAVRRIIKRSVISPEHLGKLATECFGPDNGSELDLPIREPHEPIDLNG